MKTIKILLGADMRSGHPGLKKQALKMGFDIDTLKEGEAVVFINVSKDRMKAYSWNGVLSYVRFTEKNRAIDLNAIDEFPKAFSPDGSMDYRKALRASLLKRIGDKKFKELEVL